ncbi:hypothetical protein BTVI_153330 [Pitangus sulphuratus]|nr:hypothetical protein BTVI_153330 [Pitangus sulphuratus]
MVSAGALRVVRYLLCASGDFVKVYSVTTEETLRLMGGHADLVTGIQLNPHNHMQTFTVGCELLALYTLASAEDSVFVVIPKKGERDTFQLVSVKLTKGAGQDLEAKELSVVLDGVGASPKQIAFGREGEYVVSVKEVDLQVYFFKRKLLNRFSLHSVKTKGGDNQFSCVACHPKEDCIATGHADGKIRLWRNFHHKKEYTYSTLHWHHDIVMDLAFSMEGITIINSNLRFSRSIQGLIKSRDVKTGLVVDPRTKALVMNGEPGHLQFYCLQSDQQLFSLDIVQRQYIHEAGLKQSDLVKVAFSARGTWLATVEEREEVTDPELELKLWFYEEETQSFKLNTRINTPHDNHITDMCFRDMGELEDDSLILVTTGRDCVFKVWVMVEDTDPEGKNICFGRLTCSKYLIGATDYGFLCCWNLLTCALEWSAHLNIVVLQPDPLSEHIAAVSWLSKESSCEYRGFFDNAEEVADEVEMESEKTEDDSDEERDVTEMEQEDTSHVELLGEMTCKLSKSQEKELRKIRKMDYSWISAF